MAEASQRTRVRSRKPTPEFTWEDVATASLPVVACFLGGATEKWAEGIVVALLGLYLLLNPPRFSLGVTVNLMLLAVVGCAVMAYLPASWFSEPAWRRTLVDDFGVQVASTVSPQPWMTSGCLLSFIAGLAWFYYVAGGDIEVRAARRQLRIFSLGVIVLAAAAIALHLAHTTLPFWHNARNFGPFPNRNQTGDLLGISSIVIVACAHDEIRRGRKGWIFWVVGLAIVIAAIVLNFSRAGIVILLIGNALWVAVLVLRSGSAAKIAIGASALLVLVTVVLLFGGATLERFNLRGAAGATVSNDFRWLIFRDVWQLIGASPWCGIGLGNFQPVFAIFRDASVGQSVVLHPESDWLWVWTEVGWASVVLILMTAAVLIRQVFPFGEGTNQWFRIATLIAALSFALHGIVDVGGHRVGSAYAGVFLFGLTLRRPLRWPASPWLTNSFRVVGLLLLAIGLTWLTVTYRGLALPGSVGVDRERTLATAANVARQHSETIARTTHALEWAPLDWQLYFLRALGKVGANRPAEEASEDFRRARFLQPSSFEVPYQEGLAWLSSQPALAITAWREALRRAGPERPQLYWRMLSNAMQINRNVASALEDYGFTQHDLAVAFLEKLKAPQFAPALQRLLERDPQLSTLTPPERAKVFNLWSDQGDLALLALFVEENPEQVNIAWRGVAKRHAQTGDFRAAFELGRHFADPPVLPDEPTGSSLEQLRDRYYAQRDSYAAGAAFAQALIRAGDLDDALLTIRHFTEKQGSPAYFHFLEAELWAQKHEWERAWQALERYHSARNG